MAAIIEIQTPHNVTIAFKLAPLGTRILAFVIDQIVLFTLIIILFLVSEWFAPNFRFDEFYEVVLYTAVYMVYFGYSLIMETMWNGQTIGKRLMGLRVRKEDGSVPTFFEYLVRWLFRIPDLALSAGMLAVLLIGSSKKSQRLGDMLAGTIVVQEHKGALSFVSQLQSIKTKEDYTPKYPAIVRLAEDDVLLLKEVITRKERYDSFVYSELVKSTAQRMEALLKVEREELQPLDFLKTLVREYVILTR
jgi:uncharacterized RDD family membrane protein YckC